MNRISTKPLLFIVAAFLTMTGCHAPEEESKLRVLLDQPYSTSQSAPAEESMELELVRRLAEKVGRDYELVLTKEGRSTEEVLNAGDADLALGNIVESTSLQDDFICSTSYATRPLFIVTTRGDYRNIPEVFQEEYIGLSADLSDNARHQINNSSTTILQAYTTAKAASDGLRSGAIQAYFCYEQEAFELAQEEGLQVQDAVGVEADHFIVIAPKGGLIQKDSLDYTVLSYLAERGTENVEEK